MALSGEATAPCKMRTSRLLLLGLSTLASPSHALSSDRLAVALRPKRFVAVRKLMSEKNSELERQRAALEELVKEDSAAETTFRFASSDPKPAVVDDLAQGAGEVVDVARRTSGLLVLLADVCLGGLASPAGAAFIALFALLYASGEFGSPVPFVAEPLSASEGSYYTPRVLPVDEGGPSVATDTGADDGAPAWPRLRGGSAAFHPSRLLPSRPASSTACLRAAAAVGAPCSRHPPPALFEGKGGDGDASKCPFFGGANGGGVGDANIVTGALFVACVFLLRALLLRVGRGLLASDGGLVGGLRSAASVALSRLTWLAGQRAV